MTLEQAKAEWLKEPTKRIIRECNYGFHFISVWFTVENDLLMVNGRNFHPDGMIPTKRKAPFQVSEHSDWILID